MRQAVSEFQRRAAESDVVAVIDDSGGHTARELLAHAAGLAEALAGEGGAGTVMVQADNSWRTIAATLAVGRSGGVLAVVNRHTTGAEAAAVFEDIRPDAVVAEPAAVEEWALPLPQASPGGDVLDGWAVRSGHGRRDVSRWA